MDVFLWIAGALLRAIAFEAIFFWPGWLALRIVTLGYFPRYSKGDIQDYTDIQMIALVGFLVVILIVALIAKFSPC